MAEIGSGGYRPSKALWFWSVAGAVVVTLILGFTWGGWVTGSGARDMAAEAADEARETVAAEVCVERFLAETDAGAELRALKEESSWSRRGLIEKGGWAVTMGENEIIGASGCAERLVAMDLPATAPPAAAAEAGTAVQ